jgi:hypothetical protein
MALRSRILTMGTSCKTAAISDQVLRQTPAAGKRSFFSPSVKGLRPMNESEASTAMCCFMLSALNANPSSLLTISVFGAGCKRLTIKEKSGGLVHDRFLDGVKLLFESMFY